MKKTFFPAVITLVLLMGCNSDRQQMESNARGYLEAMGNYRIDEAIPYSTQFTRKNTLPIAKKLTEKTNPAFIQSNTPADITIKGSKRLTDTSAMVYYHKHTPITEQDDSLTLLLEDGQWLVDVRIRRMPIPLNDSMPQALKGDSILIKGEYHALKDLGKAKKVKRTK